MEGVYQNLKDSKYQSRTRYLEMRLKEAYDHWRSVYTDISSLDQLRLYLEKLPPKNRELFLDMSGFVFILFNELDKIPPCLQDAVAIVSICSIIERVQATKNRHISLGNWLKEKKTAETLEELMQTRTPHEALVQLVDLFHSKYGSTQAVADFFNSYFDKEEKGSLIRDYRVQTRYIPRIHAPVLRRFIPEFSDTWTLEEVKQKLGNQVELEDGFLPVCYGVTCYIEYGRCFPNVSCRLKDQKLLEDSLRRVARRLVYGYRNRFVHQARLPILASGANKGEKALFSSIVLDLLDDTIVEHSLDLNSLLKAFQSSLRRFFDTSTKTAG
jgi:hypothetical protein